MSNKQSPDTDLKAAVLNAIESNRHLAGPLLPILHQIQNELGHVPSQHVIDIAQGLNLSRAEVHGVISFYHSFTTAPHGKHVIEVCRAESCQAMGGREIEASVKATLGIDFEQTTDDGQFTLEPVYCLGNCGCSPAIKINSDIYGRVTSESVTGLIEQLKSEQA
jgi:formate dehydrogenase subunit gamma